MNQSFTANRIVLSQTRPSIIFCYVEKEVRKKLLQKVFSMVTGISE